MVISTRTPVWREALLVGLSCGLVVGFLSFLSVGGVLAPSVGGLGTALFLTLYWILAKPTRQDGEGATGQKPDVFRGHSKKILVRVAALVAAVVSLGLLAQSWLVVMAGLGLGAFWALLGAWQRTHSTR